jgi:tetratricopeptide (TPR) repeat protein
MPDEEAIIWKNRGDEFIKNEKYEDAIKCYKEALKINPNYVSAWNNLGYSYFKLGRKDYANKCKEKIGFSFVASFGVSSSSLVMRLPQTSNLL